MFLSHLGHLYTRMLFDFGWMITGVMPSFDQNDKLIGVAGLDIPINEIMYRYGIS